MAWVGGLVLRVMVERVTGAGRALTTTSRPLVGMRSAVGVGVLDPAVTVALASQRLIAQEGLVSHNDEATPAAQRPTVNSVGQDRDARGRGERSSPVSQRV
jgi:hypothetical protein